MYVTPTRFRYSGLGIDVSGLSDADIRGVLVRAATRVDAYCNTPTLPQRFSFKGGTMLGEKHAWTDMRNRRVYPSAFPIISVESLRVDATNNLYVDFATDELYVNYAEGYVEIINFAITKAGIWGEANVPQLGLSQPVALIDYTYGTRYAVVDEQAVALPTVSGGPTQYLAENGYWDPAVAVEVKKNDSIVSSGFNLDRDTGLITFDTPNAEADTVAASYTYRVDPDIVEGNNLIAVAMLGERSLAAKGLTGLDEIEVEEVRLRRTRSRGADQQTIDVPDAAKSFLDGHRFWTVR